MLAGKQPPKHREAKGQRPSQANSVARCALRVESGAELFHTPGADGVPYATIAVDGHLETWPIHATIFRHELERRLYRATGTMPTAHATQAALGLLTGEALFNGSERPVFTRLAEHEDAIYLDLGDPAWRAVEITRWGWRIVARPPVKFRRARGLLALPRPLRGGSIHAQRRGRRGLPPPRHVAPRRPPPVGAVPPPRLAWRAGRREEHNGPDPATAVRPEPGASARRAA